MNLQKKKKKLTRMMMVFLTTKIEIDMYFFFLASIEIKQNLFRGIFVEISSYYIDSFHKQKKN